MSAVKFDLTPLTPADIPDPSTPEFGVFLDERFALGQRLVESMDNWHDAGTKHHGTVQILDLPSSSTYNAIRKDLAIKEYWCARSTEHTSADLETYAQTAGGAVSSPVEQRRASHATEDGAGAEASEEERQAAVMRTRPEGIYERFRRGLLEYHSEHEREYIESLRESQCLHVYQKHVAEVWRMTYQTPAPSSPRTFIVLLLSREIVGGPRGERCFMNVSIPFSHPACPEKVGDEKARVRGRYTSVEWVREGADGDSVRWKMATSSDAGGNIPRFITNSSLAGSIAEDVPSFLKWLVRTHPSAAGA